MRTDTLLPTLDAAKDQARRLRSRLTREGNPVSHSRSLELIAIQYGFRDWNTLHAALGNRSGIENLRPGSRVRGHYLGQPFSAKLLGIEMRSPAVDRYRVVLELDEAVDVVTFDSFSAFRKRVTGHVGTDGISREHTSNGQPQLELNW